MTQTPIATEISQYLQHGDFALALRRLLDCAYDSQQLEWMAEATQFSKNYRKLIAENNSDNWKAAFQNEAQGLIQKIANAPNASASPSPLLQAEAITKRYASGNFGLQPIYLHLNAGEIVGVVGENGNGKTTLLRCLSGQLAIDAGRMTYPRLKMPDAYQVQNYVAFIPQRIPRWYGQLKDNLHFSAAIAGILGKRNDVLVELMLERFGLTEFATLNWTQISSGYRTRFEIARVLLSRPSVLILDEPLANLDINAQQTLLTDLRFLTKSSTNPFGVLLTSQQLHEVEKIADRVLLIRQGACISQTDTMAVANLGFALELETPDSRERVQAALQNLEIEIQFNGGNFTLVSKTHSTNELIKQLVLADISIRYCRDITSSTKRLF
ncbi:MAG: ATP-binding cassette domain-containing protein [Bacteroidia bacterium]